MRLLLAVALAAASPWAFARPSAGAPPPPPPATLEVTGQARASEAPDRVYIDIGVMTEARHSASAASQNARRLAAVIAAVRRVAGPGAQLTTTEYTLSPRYDAPRDGAPTLVGYTASNVIRVRLDDLNRLGAVLDAATGQGSNQVRDIRFAVRDETRPRTEALRKAARAARQEAQVLADALGLRVVRVLRVGEQSPVALPPPIYPQARRFAAATVAPVTPIEPGTIAVNATVTLTVEVAPARR